MVSARMSARRRASTSTSTARCSAAARRCCTTATGAVSLLGVRAVEACLRADFEVVMMSGRRRAQVAEDARLLGQRVVHLRGRLRARARRRAAVADRARRRASARVHEQIEDSGAPALLLEHYAGRLEYHDPWHESREISHLFRGRRRRRRGRRAAARARPRRTCASSTTACSPPLAALADLDAAARLPPDPGRRLEGGRGRAAHARARAARARTRSRSATRARTSPSPAVVGTFWLVANGLERDPTLRRGAARRTPTCASPRQGHGAGVYEAVITTLAERR